MLLPLPCFSKSCIKIYPELLKNIIYAFIPSQIQDNKFFHLKSVDIGSNFPVGITPMAVILEII